MHNGFIRIIEPPLTSDNRGSVDAINHQSSGDIERRTPSWQIENAFRHPRVPKYEIVYPYYSNPRP